VSLTKTLRRNKEIATLRQSSWNENSIFMQILGICSALAVTNLMVNTLVMCAGLIFASMMSSFTVSLLRNHTPHRVRLMTQVSIIAGFVICVDIIIRAYLPHISEALGPYVGLIITNCIIMGRCEGYALRHKPFSSLLDGFGSGFGYSLVLMTIAFFRELLGFGSLMGIRVMPDNFTSWTIMVMPPGAFFMLGLIIWLGRALLGRRAQIGNNAQAKGDV
jgi:Na+-transporting NADH:ubiquinone oxidoreductase subunit D